MASHKLGQTDHDAKNKPLVKMASIFETGNGAKLQTLAFCARFTGVTDAAAMPLLALLVDQRHTTTYDAVYAIVQLAVCLAYFFGKFSNFIFVLLF